MNRHVHLVGLVALASACGARSSLDPGELGGGGGSGGAQSASVSSGMGGFTTSVGGAPNTSSSTATSTVSSSASSTASSSSSGPACSLDLDCDDSIDCTLDTCQAGSCAYAGIDAACDDGIDCTFDFCDGLNGCVNEAHHSDCVDGLMCTADVCDGDLGCTNPHTDAACADGISCTLDTCDAFTDTCRNEPCDGLCDDGIFCDGVERCDTGLGCVDGPPGCSLDLTLPCASSSCNESSDKCSHFFLPGCPRPDVHLLVTDAQGRLFDVAPFGMPTQVLIAPQNGIVHLDIAILGARWFVLDATLRELQPGTNQVIRDLGFAGGNSLGSGPDGNLYIASSYVFRVDPDTSASEMLGQLPEGHTSSGDIAFLGDRMFVSTDSGCGGALVEFDVITGTGTVLGGDGLGCVYGLAPIDGVLYIVNCDGTIGTFDPDTGEVRLVATSGVLVYGADAMP